MEINRVLFIAVLLVSLTVKAQTPPNGYRKIDAQLKHWLSQPQQLVKEQPALFKYGPVKTPMIPIIVKSASTNLRSLIMKYGGEVHTQLGDIYTAIIPLDGILQFAAHHEIIRIESAEKVRVTNQKAKELTGADRVQAGQLPDGTAYTGKGVIVGIMDSGIDFTHPDFRKKSDNTQTRILSIWDQTKNSSAAPQNYNYGSEYTNTQINAALSNPNTLNTTDSNGHGTHVAGSAAGLRGMAPDADIIVVSAALNWDSDSTLYQDTKSLLDGLNYMKEKAVAAGKPCVVNVSIGYNLGSPHDGTSLVEQGFDFLVNNTNGFFIVVAAGNETGKEIHFGGFELTQDSVWTYIKSGMLYSVFNSNYSDSTYLSFSVDSAIAKSADWGNLVMQKPVFQSAWFSVSTIKNTVNGMFIPARYSNGDTAMMIHVTASDFDANRTEVRIFTNHGRQEYNDSIWDFGMAKLSIKGKGKLHAWWENYQVDYIDNPYFYANVYKNERHKSSDDNYMMNILACGHKTIVVGAFINQSSFKNKNGKIEFGQNYNQDSSGAFAHFSSLGPTTDGRMKPDISAPGLNVSSSFSRHAAFPISWHIDNTTVALSGTSMAAPIVTGAIALYLEKHPAATFENIKSALCANAIVDSLVTKYGAVPNNHFGFGRLDIYKAMGGPFNTAVQSKHIDDEQVWVYPNPAREYVIIPTTVVNDLAEVRVFDVTGKLITQSYLKDKMTGFVFDVQSWKKGIYFFCLIGAAEKRFGKFIVE